MFPFVIVLLLRLISLSWSQQFSPYETRPRIYIENGHMYIRAGRNRNISFSADGSGSVFFETIDVKSLPTLGHVRLYQQQVSDVQSNAASIRSTVSTLSQTQNGLQQSMTTMQGQLIETNDCATNPCVNAGTCIDLVGKFLCLCPKEFTGPTCAIDVDECQASQGTSLACQNGGTCVNTVGGFTCTCPPAYFGYRCTEQKDDCQAGSSHLLCGPAGICIPNSNKVQGQASYRCICDTGYQSNNSPINPQCADVNECAAGAGPCYPGVQCINIPGSFRCGNCPLGLTGNGAQCWDIDECAQNNGGCSMEPQVQCLNTQGSYRCGSCPNGYQGDGRTCRKANLCQTNPCYPSAICFEMPESLSGYRCQCPEGFVGLGVGGSGCQASMFDPCQSNPCLNGGTCQAPSPTRYNCLCPKFYSGNVCQTPSGCLTAPCLNGGTCVQLPGSFVEYMCRCPPNTYGRLCEMQEEGCNANYMQDSGNFTYPNDSIYKNLAICEWTIVTSMNKVLNITFPMFDLENSTRPGCPFDNLTLYDGATDQSDEIGVYCSSKGSAKGPDAYIITSTNQLFVRFKSDLTIQQRGFTIKWTTVEPGIFTTYYHRFKIS